MNEVFLHCAQCRNFEFAKWRDSLFIIFMLKQTTQVSLLLLQKLLYIVIKKMKYDDDYDFEEEVGNSRV